MRKTTLCGAVLAIAVASQAQAADVNAKQGIKAAPPVLPLWSGFYAGFGLGFRTTRTDVRTISVTFAGDPVELAPLATSLPFDGTAFRTSPYIGFNWQIAPRWVAALEADIGFANQTTARGGYTFSPAAAVSGVAADGLALKTTADASLRARFGMLLAPATLAYVTGGVAWQRYEVASRCADTGSSCAGNGYSPVLVTNTITRPGWTAGGGIETALSNHWVARVEYRYADFGTVPFAIARSSTVPVRNPTVDNFDVTMRTHTATFGLAYKFGDPIAGDVNGWASVLSLGKASTAMSWTGAYAGLGLGARASRTDLQTTSATQGAVLVNLTQAATSMPLDGTAFRASPYLGVNWQFAPRWVAGLEGDAGFAKQTRTLAGFPFSPGVLAVRRADDSLAVKTTWDAAVRGRLGFLLTPATLAYVTGGAAWQHYEVTSVCASPDVCGVFGFAPVVIANSTTKAGWTAGGGIETALWGHWLARGEYRYSDFGAAPFSIARSSPIPVLNPTVAAFEAKLRTHIVSFGLAYKFN